MVLFETQMSLTPSQASDFSHPPSSEMSDSMCGSPPPHDHDHDHDHENFAHPSSLADCDRRGGSTIIPQRKEREFTPDTRKDESYWDRRRRNNEAAKRSREKRRMNDMVLETRVLELSNENQWLKAELNAIRDKCGMPKDAPPLVNPAGLPSHSPPLGGQHSASSSPFSNMLHPHSQGPHQQPLLRPAVTSSSAQPAPLQMAPHFVSPNMQPRGPMMMHPMHPALLGAHPGMQGRILMPNQHMYIPANMVPHYNRMTCQSVSPHPRSLSSASRDSPLSDTHENGGAISPSIAAVSSLLKLANSHFNGYPHLPREEDAEVFASSSKRPDKASADSKVNNHLPLKLRHKSRVEPSCSPPLGKSSGSSSSAEVSSPEEDDVDIGSGYSGSDSAVDVECEDSRDALTSRKRKLPQEGVLEHENVHLRGELQRLASEVANLKVMMKQPEGVTQPPAKKSRKSKSRR
ncbi:hypothetical protein RvY_18571 [Ramazzottius varieornatus]|uniref:BZIP domain-containing protein n=1 Tax=Ramazzottius varieornatus TaxID=947166 RepID=A0A1D1W6A3_RAMVA|nr:hypothetical protein RvY_18571 [Ramazzottius varieornatus]